MPTIIFSARLWLNKTFSAAMLAARSAPERSWATSTLISRARGSAAAIRRERSSTQRFLMFRCADRQSVTQMEADCGVPSVDPVAFNLLNFQSNQFGAGAGGYLYPLPTNIPSTTPCLAPVPFVLTDPGKFSDNQFTANWDREFRNGKDRLSERFFWSNSDTFEPFGADSFGIQTGGLPGTNNLNFPLDIPLHSRFGSITETHVFSNSLINEFRFGVNIISDKLNNEAPVTGRRYRHQPAYGHWSEWPSRRS